MRHVPVIGYLEAGTMIEQRNLKFLYGPVGRVINIGNAVCGRYRLFTILSRAFKSAHFTAGSVYVARVRTATQEPQEPGSNKRSAARSPPRSGHLGAMRPRGHVSPPRHWHTRCTLEAVHDKVSALEMDLVNQPLPLPGYTDKIDFKRVYTVTFAIGSEFIMHALDDSEPTADLQGNKKRIPCCQVCGNAGAAANEQTSETRLYKGLWSLTYRGINTEARWRNGTFDVCVPVLWLTVARLWGRALILIGYCTLREREVPYWLDYQGRVRQTGQFTSSGRGGGAVSLLASHHGEPDLQFPPPPPLHSCAAPYTSRSTLIGSQDLDNKSRLNLSTLNSTPEAPVADDQPMKNVVDHGRHNQWGIPHRKGSGGVRSAEGSRPEKKCDKAALWLDDRKSIHTPRYVGFGARITKIAVMTSHHDRQRHCKTTPGAWTPAASVTSWLTVPRRHSSHEVRTEQRQNARAGETGEPREIPPTSDIAPGRNPRAKIWEWPGRGLNPVRLCRFASVCLVNFQPMASKRLIYYLCWLMAVGRALKECSLNREQRIVRFSRFHEATLLRQRSCNLPPGATHESVALYVQGAEDARSVCVVLLAVCCVPIGCSRGDLATPALLQPPPGAAHDSVALYVQGAEDARSVCVVLLAVCCVPIGCSRGDLATPALLQNPPGAAHDSVALYVQGAEDARSVCVVLLAVCCVPIGCSRGDLATPALLQNPPGAAHDSVALYVQGAEDARSVCVVLLAVCCVPIGCSRGDLATPALLQPPPPPGATHDSVALYVQGAEDARSVCVVLLAVCCVPIGCSRGDLATPALLQNPPGAAHDSVALYVQGAEDARSVCVVLLAVCCAVHEATLLHQRSCNLPPGAAHESVALYVQGAEDARSVCVVLLAVCCAVHEATLLHRRSCNLPPGATHESVALYVQGAEDARSVCVVLLAVCCVPIGCSRNYKNYVNNTERVELRDLGAPNDEVLRADAGETTREWSSAGMRGWGKREIPEKNRPASSGTIPTCESPRMARPGIEPGSPWCEASDLTARPPRPQYKTTVKNVTQDTFNRTDRRCREVEVCSVVWFHASVGERTSLNSNSLLPLPPTNRETPCTRSTMSGNRICFSLWLQRLAAVRLPPTLSFPPAPSFKTEKCWNDKGDIATLIKFAITAKRKAVNWRSHILRLTILVEVAWIVPRIRLSNKDVRPGLSKYTFPCTAPVTSFVRVHRVYGRGNGD
ncbi:hypothetical protein PR048_030712 [Dryococelus australis]|uniref:Uncharacterized protein n=1 Tax=Dryococelus australis TaxID=614101 RepID=A0ABQ9GDJ6_9NEOP|nr:hypothetical protein PR048_030712 [Dryococelus australis]